MGNKISDLAKFFSPSGRINITRYGLQKFDRLLSINAFRYLLLLKIIHASGACGACDNRKNYFVRRRVLMV